MCPYLIRALPHHLCVRISKERGATCQPCEPVRTLHVLPSRAEVVGRGCVCILCCVVHK